MMNTKVKAIAKKVLPVMMVPVLLFGNYATITSYADDVEISASSTEEKQKTETEQNSTSTENGPTTNGPVIIDGEDKSKPVEPKSEFGAEQDISNSGDLNKQEDEKLGGASEQRDEAGNDLPKQNGVGADGSTEQNGKETVEPGNAESNDLGKMDGAKSKDVARNLLTSMAVIGNTGNQLDLLTKAKDGVSNQDNQAKNTTASTPKVKKCNISFNIENRAEGDFKLYLDGDEIDGNTYSFDVSEDSESREIVFNYALADNYKLEEVSGGTIDTEEKTITCSYEDIDFGDDSENDAGNNNDNENNNDNDAGNNNDNEDSNENNNNDGDGENNTDNNANSGSNSGSHGQEELSKDYTFSATVIKIDDEGPSIESPSVKNDTGAVSYEGSGGKRVIASSTATDLVFTINVTDDEKSDVKEVIAVDSTGARHFMDKADGDEGTYVWSPSRFGNYLITEVIAKDEWDNESSFPNDNDAGNSGIAEDFPTICYYPENDENKLSVNTIDNNGQWQQVNKLTFGISISGSTIREIEAVKIKKTDESGNESVINVDESQIQRSFSDSETPGGAHAFSATVNIPVEEGEKIYEVSCHFYGDSGKDQNDNNIDIYKTFATKTVRIDNTAPSAEIVVEGDENEINRTSFGRFFRDLKRGWFAANNDITVLIKVPKNCDGETDEKKVSGFSSITYKVNDKEVTKSVDKINPAKSTDEYYVFEEKIKSTGENEIDKYAVQVLSVCDFAGNVAYSVDGIKEFGRTRFIIDRTAPTIVYDIDGQVAQDENRLYFDGSARGKVTIEDIDLDVDSIKFRNEDGSVKYVVPSYNEKDSTELSKRIYDFLLENDGAYKIETTASDTLGQTSSETSTEIVVDKTAPKIEITYDKEAPSADGNKYYPSNVQITVKVNDKWLDKTSSFVRVKKIDVAGGEVGVEPLNNWSGDLGDDEHVITFTTDGDGFYQVSVEANDMSKNHDSAEGNKFGVDTTVPEVTLTFDENDPHNDKYYDKARTATITVTDFSFNEDEAKLAVDEQIGKASASSWANTAVNVYTRTVSFEQDGKYTLKFNCKDKAGNSSNEVSEAEFVIDRTAPEINVSYNSLTPGNGKYYKDTRIANVNIKEMSFDDKLVELAPQPVSDLGTMPGLGGFSSSDDKNVSQISFSEDGTYGYIIKCKDLAGNTATEYMSDIFVIDKTAPEVSFSGVENFSANNGEVAPTVVYGDKYIDIQASKVTLKGANNGPVNVGSSVKQIENGFAVSYSDFAHDKSMDDLYVLEATVCDMAGNQTKDELVFSVNRHGSVFVVGDVARKFNEKYYINAPKDITITEINIDELTQKDVSISRDGSIRELVNGKDYSVSRQGSDTSWKTYTYTIGKKNFGTDGIYSVTVYSKDKATNIQDNKSRDAEITFAVDMTAPGIVTAGLEEGGVYKQDSLDFNVDVTDNMGVENLTIYKDGQIVKACTGEELEGAGGVETITLNESEERQSVTVIAQDYAGNKETLAIGGVLVSTKEIPVETEDVLGQKKENPTKKKAAKNGLSFFVYALAAVAALSVGGGAIYLLKANNKVEK
ncbi:Bacterial Ig-like domain (group 3) [Butyrivibrio hungatei]|uniref:Bacterial Ig-like domain (Group 3) n=1 Tax=Butyrivibrio hungatei TaxID=185008 RepID=A0A1G5G3V0_9FIRM|nr:Ig-like domain-containing protein [Butyrivibrio hungatei]SCY46235.1 Bacterial Ig-like domain (group 3) [Butyrivibrio hungatei]